MGLGIFGGGGGLSAGTPRQILNWHLWYAVLLFGLLGAARGFDEGNVSGMVSQLSFISQFGLHDPSLSEGQRADLLSNITAMVQIGCVGGALFAFLLTDRIGRVRSLQALCLVWMLGVVIQITSRGNVGQLYAGRFIAGLGIGQTTVVGPTYLVEVAPRELRGLCTCAFSGSVYLGIMLGYFANWGTSLHIANDDRNQWVIPTSVQIIFAGIVIMGSVIAIESPRWYCKVGRPDTAADALSKIRNLPADHEYITWELNEIQDQLSREAESTSGTSVFSSLREFLLPANRYRLMLGVMSQLLGQWSGANAVTVYAPTFFSLVGVSGQNEKLFATAIFGVVKFASAIICALFLVDFIGRKRSLSVGITIQFISILYVGIYLALNPKVGDDDDDDSGRGAATPSTAAQKAAIAMIYFNGVGWALGWNSIQYLINAEIFPLNLRGLATSFVMCVHFVNQYGNSKALPGMLLAMNNWGAMIFFAGVCLLGLAWVWMFLPETKRVGLEGLDEIFEGAWWKIGRRRGRVEVIGGGKGASAVGEGEKVEGEERAERAERAERV